jgi:hypothetical protein
VTSTPSKKHLRLPSKKAGGLVVQNDTFFEQLAALASRLRLPTIYEERENVQAGGLMSYPLRPTRHRSPSSSLRSLAFTFRVNQIPIAEPAAPSAHFTRGFVPWRLSDDGRAASRTISIGRHPKPLYGAFGVN